MTDSDSMAISKFKATCLAALDRVRRTGRPLLVTRRGLPIAQITPVPPSPATSGAFGSMKEGAKEVGDVLEPLPSEDWETLR